MIDTHEVNRAALQKNLDSLPVTTTSKPKGTIMNAISQAVVYVLKNSNHPSNEPWFQMVREMIQKVVISPSPDYARAELTIYGRLASILASMAAWEEFSKAHRQQATTEFTRLLKEGHFKTQGEKIDFKNRFDAHLEEQYNNWERLQILVVAGARNYRYRHLFSIGI